jgi:hypothetical protein
MDLTSIGEYLAGKVFSNSLNVKISGIARSIPLRMETIENIVHMKNVIHFGCADHLEIIEEKISKNIWFHSRLLSCTNKCIGIDNNIKAVDYLLTKLHIRDVYCLDIDHEEIPTDIVGEHYDYLIMGEIIEHVDNPVSFLNTIHTKFKNNVDSIIITAPNAFRWNNIRNAFRNKELINSDHRYWFSPYTLSKVIYQSGFQDINLYLVENFKSGKYAFIKSYLFRHFPAIRDTVLIEAKFN